MQRLTKQILIVGVFALAVESEALAADLPMAPPPPPPRAPAAYVPAPIPYYNWSGFYIGGNLGWGFSSPSASDPWAAALPARPANRFSAAARLVLTGSSDPE